MFYHDNVDDLLSDALSLSKPLDSTEKILTSCNLLRNDDECNDDLLRLSAQSIPTVYGVKSIPVAMTNIPIEAIKPFLNEKTKYLKISLLPTNNDYLGKIKNTFNKAFPLIVINANKLHTLNEIYRHHLENDENSKTPRVRHSIYSELFNLTLSRMGCTTIDTPKILYEFLSLISVPFDWVDIYNLIIKYCGLNFLLIMLNPPAAQLFKNQDDVNDTPLVLMRYTNSKTIDLIQVYEKGSSMFMNLDIDEVQVDKKIGSNQLTKLLDI